MTAAPPPVRFGVREMDLEHEAARRVGTTLRNKWTLERMLGAGGMAAVYVGIHKIGRREAVKSCTPMSRASPRCAPGSSRRPTPSIG